MHSAIIDLGVVREMVYPWTTWIPMPQQLTFMWASSCPNCRQKSNVMLPPIPPTTERPTSTRRSTTTPPKRGRHRCHLGVCQEWGHWIGKTSDQAHLTTNSPLLGLGATHWVSPERPWDQNLTSHSETRSASLRGSARLIYQRRLGPLPSHRPNLLHIQRLLKCRGNSSSISSSILILSFLIWRQGQVGLAWSVYRRCAPGRWTPLAPDSWPACRASLTRWPRSVIL